ncbi:MAG: hypothetical protein ACE5EK_08020, partial [Nitrospinales bacterium]
NTIVLLMFLNGILFLGLNFVAYSIVNPGGRGSKRTGYVLIVIVILMVCSQQEFRALGSLDFSPKDAGKILFVGFITPVFLCSLAYYRWQRNRQN